MFLPHGSELWVPRKETVYSIGTSEYSNKSKSCMVWSISEKEGVWANANIPFATKTVFCIGDSNYRKLKISYTTGVQKVSFPHLPVPYCLSQGVEIYTYCSWWIYLQQNNSYYYISSFMYGCHDKLNIQLLKIHSNMHIKWKVFDIYNNLNGRIWSCIRAKVLCIL